MMDHERFRELIGQLYGIVGELQEMFPGRPFTPDGHMVGSIGECLVADRYGLTLMPPSNRGFDAKSADGIEVEIKATQADRVAFRSCPRKTIVVKILRDGTIEEYYNGPGERIWREFEGRKRPSNGQFQIGLRRLKQLSTSVNAEERIPRLSRPRNPSRGC